MGFTPPPPTQPRQGLAIASLVIGILSVPTLGCLGVGAVLSIVLGITALVRAGRDPREYGGRGFAIGGIVASAILARGGHSARGYRGGHRHPQPAAGPRIREEAATMGTCAR